jgi:MFS family permease
MIKENKRWIYVILGILIMMFLGTVYSYSVFRASIEDTYIVGTTLSGLPYMISLASYAAFMFISGRFIKTVNPKIIIAVGGLLVAFGWVLTSFTSNIYTLTLTYGIVIGAGVGVIYGVPMDVVAKWFPESKGFIVGLVLLGFGLSPFITAPLSRVLIERFGLHNTFLILGLSFGILIPLFGAAFKYPVKEYETQKIKKDDDKKKIKDFDTVEMIKTKTFKGLYLNFIIGTMIGLTVIGLTTMIGTEIIGISEVNVAFFMSLFAVFNGVGRPIFGWLTDNLSSKKAMVVSFGLIFTASLLMIFAGRGNAILYGISLSIYWLNLGGWLAIAPTSTIKLFGLKNYSQNYGVVFTAYGIGALVGVGTSGMIIDILGSFKYLFYYIILLSILGILITKRYINN